jgi:drug/metabolite transporter (DMT)-like permease
LQPTQLIRIDYLGGLSAGLAMLLLHPWLANLYQVPTNLLLALAAINLAYGATSFTLARRTRHQIVPGLKAMGIANLAWSLCCLILFTIWQGQATPFALAHFLFEGAFVAILGILEIKSSD